MTSVLFWVVLLVSSSAASSAGVVASKLGPVSIFANGFESGLTCSWSSITPTPSTCENFTTDACETDVDCGGGQCDPCADFNDCVEASDCQSEVCSDGVCAQCAFAEDCPPEVEECLFPTCTKGVCGVGYAAPATPCTGGECDGAGACVPFLLDVEGAFG